MKLKTLTAAVLMTVTAAAQAASISAPSATFAGTVIDFNAFDGYVLPQVDMGVLVTDLDVGGGVSLTTTAFANVGADNAELGTNGAWTVLGNSNRDGNFVSTAFTKNTGSLTFSFATAQQQVGIFANQFQSAGVLNSLSFSALDMAGNVLETASVSIDTDELGYDEGMFIGFQRDSADIYGFALTDGSFVVDNLTISAVPEPETYAMLLAGLAAIGAAARRRRA